MTEDLGQFVRAAGIVFGFPAVSFTFGWSVLGRFTQLDREERFAVSWGVSFAALASSQLLAFLTGADAARINLGGLVLMLVVAALCRLAGHPRAADSPSAWWPLGALWLLGYLQLVCIQAVLPNYMGAGWCYDWWMHYDEALVLHRVAGHPINTDWVDYSLASRTPLFNLTGAFVLSLAGKDFWVFQLASALMNSCFTAAAYLLLRDLFGRRAAPLALLMAPLNLWMMHNAWFTWPKMLAAYYLLLGLHFYLQSLRRRVAEQDRARRSFLFFWASMLLGIMTHSSGVVYLAPLLLHAAALTLRYRRFFLRPVDVVAMVAVGLVAFGPWYGWLIGTFGVEHIRSASPLTVMPHKPFTPLNIAEYLGANLGCSFFPVNLYLGPGTWEGLYDGLTHLYFCVVPGALTLSLTVFLLFSLVRSVVRYSHGHRSPSGGQCGHEWSAVWAFVLFGIVGATALHPQIIAWGTAHSAFFPSVIVLAALGWGWLSRLPRGWAAVVCLGMVAEFLVMFWSHWWIAVKRPLLLDPDEVNPWYKTNPWHPTEGPLVFLNDWIRPWQPACLAGAVVVQLALCYLLVHWLQGRNEEVDAPSEARGGAGGPARMGQGKGLETL
jgi:hypothetical protein